MLQKILFRFAATFCLLLLLSVNVHGAESNFQAGTVQVRSGSLNVRASASSSSSKLASLQMGSYVTLLSKTGNWWKVEYAENRFGYCHENYIKQVSSTPLKVTTQSGSLNVRSGPGTSYTRSGTLSKGETVLRLSESGSWSYILYDGTKTGYVSTQYLSQSYAPISFWVRNMKQADPRWADLEVSTSGKSMAQIGCATTAIAMLESHRTGIVRYPDEMMNLLTYTPSGSVYWPSHYRTVTDGANYLQVIYRLLNQGKPILFGATNAYGSQHWVIITGFTGGNTLTADRFTIQDPGSNSRTNLQQFLSAYPNFYKFFYY